MKQLTCILILSLFMTCIHAKQKYKRLKKSDVTEVDGQLFHQEEALEGHYRIKYKRKTFEESEFENGKRKGFSKSVNHGFVTQLNYEDGLKHGEQVDYYRDSDTSSVFHYNKGVLDGWRTFYSIISPIKDSTLYKQGCKIRSVKTQLDGKVLERCVYKGKDKSCIQFQEDKDVHKDYEIIDSLFYSHEILTKRCSYVNDQLDFEMTINSRIDSLNSDHDEMIKVSFIKQGEVLKEYEIHLEPYNFFYQGDVLIRYLQYGYNTYFSEQESKIVNRFTDACFIFREIALMEAHEYTRFFVTENGKTKELGFQPDDNYFIGYCYNK